MLSYRHASHAGNFADVLKHLVLSLTIEHLKQVSKSILYIDTHAGSGLYHLDCEMNESSNGVMAIDFTLLPDSVAPYHSCIRTYLKDHCYPGSPLIASNMLGNLDQLHLFEIHPTEYFLLCNLFDADSRVRVDQSDGYQALHSLQSTHDSQIVILMDPPYETEDDYKLVVDTLKQSHLHTPEIQHLIWYPVTHRSLVNKMLEQIRQTKHSDIWRYELGKSSDTDDNSMTASGVIAIRPSSTVNRAMAELLPAICHQLGPSAYYQIEELSASC